MTNMGEPHPVLIRETEYVEVCTFRATCILKTVLSYHIESWCWEQVDWDTQSHKYPGGSSYSTPQLYSLQNNSSAGDQLDSRHSLNKKIKKSL